MVQMNIPYVFKRCTKCSEWLVACSVNFHKQKRGKYGLESKCKECKAEYDKQWREDNKDKRREYDKQYYENNREYKKQYYEDNKDKVKQYREKNRDKRREYHKQYRATPQGQVVAFNGHHKRKVQKKKQGNGITKEQWLECMKFFGFRCAYSGQVLSKGTRSLDHVKPLNKGGEHEIWNLVPMDKGLNSSKKDKDLLEWYKEQPYFSEERLQKIYEWQAYAFTKYGK